jgi:alkylated DNA repair protein (DNA oxidative demethylase)
MAEGAVLLRGAALAFEKELLAALNNVTTTCLFRHMVTPGGYTMSVAMTNCGVAGWVTDRTGYRYDRTDPVTGNPWPLMPDCFPIWQSPRRPKPAIRRFVPTHA